jgi:tripartite-type tricarboxylate transporter receptor subunit TctC
MKETHRPKDAARPAGGRAAEAGAFSIMAPAKTPPVVLRKPGSEISRALRTPAIVQRPEQQALIPVLDTPEEFAQELRKEREHWEAFIRRVGIQAE